MILSPKSQIHHHHHELLPRTHHRRLNDLNALSARRFGLGLVNAEYRKLFYPILLGKVSYQVENKCDLDFKFVVNDRFINDDDIVDHLNDVINLQL